MSLISVSRAAPSSALSRAPSVQTKANQSLDSVLDFYKDVLDLDASAVGGRPEIVIEEGMNNAFWDGTKMHVGTGDGQQMGPLNSVDIEGHELSHELVNRTAGLVWFGEAGGLSEGFADIFGTAAEWHASQSNPAEVFDWMVGEDAWTPGVADDAIRYMDDPAKDGFTIDNYANIGDAREIHSMAGIIDNAFSLVAKGGKNRTSGMEVTSDLGVATAAKIFYGALTKLSSNANFRDARLACIQAAKEQLGANDPAVNIVRQAWAAVGVE